MAFRAGKLPVDWDKPVPEALWPDTLLAAIRSDISALTSRRAILTLVKWRRALEGEDATAAREARQRLRAVGLALMGGPVLPEDPVTHDSGAFTVEAFERPPGEREFDQTVGVERPKTSDAEIPVSRAFDVDAEPPTAQIVLPGGARSADGPDVPLDAEAHESGTVDGIDLSRSPAISEEVGIEKPTVHIPVRPPLRPPARSPIHSVRKEMTREPHKVAPVRAISNLPADEKAALEAVEPQSQTEDELLSPSRLAPKPGVIRRRSVRAGGPAPPRPRATMHHVRTLYAVLLPFAEELVPLAFERRSRRFWARWREVAGEHGVRRSFVEELLRASTDARSMVCELIAEVHSVDPSSVSVLVDRLNDGAASAPPAPAPARPRTGARAAGKSPNARENG